MINKSIIRCKSEALAHLSHFKFFKKWIWKKQLINNWSNHKWKPQDFLKILNQFYSLRKRKRHQEIIISFKLQVNKSICPCIFNQIQNTTKWKNKISNVKSLKCKHALRFALTSWTISHSIWMHTHSLKVKNK